MMQHQPRRQDGVLAFVAANPGATVTQIHQALSRSDATMTYPTVCDAARRLLARSLLRKTGTATLQRSPLFLGEQDADAPTS